MPSQTIAWNIRNELARSTAKTKQNKTKWILFMVKNNPFTTSTQLTVKKLLMNDNTGASQRDTGNTQEQKDKNKTKGMLVRQEH